MAFTHAQLLAFPSQDEALAEIIGVLEELGFDTTDWVEGSKQRTLLMMSAFIYSKLAERNASIAKQTDVAEATGDGLTVLAKSFFDNSRVLGQKTQGNMGLDLATGQGPYTFSPFDIRVSDGNVTFTNISAGTLTAAQPRTTMSFQAEAVGAAYNIDDRNFADYLQMITTIVGVKVNTTPGTGSTWITRPGTDDEQDTRLQDRCTTKWSTLAAVETIKDRVVNVCLQTTGVTGVFVDDESSPVPGGFTAYVSNDLFTATTAQVTECFQRLTGSVMNGASRVLVLPASASVFDRNLTLYYSPSYTEAQVTTQVSGTLDSLIARSPIGGDTYGALEHIFNINDVIAGIEDLPSIRKVSVSPIGDIPLFDNTGNGQPAKLTRPNAGYNSLLTFVKVK
jgi:hypothetical protein